MPSTGVGAPVSRFLGGPHSIPLPGLYDDDFLTDLAVYDPTTAVFRLSRSGANWPTNPHITRSFGTEYVAQTVPSMVGTSLQRAGAIPLSGMTQPRKIPFGSGPFQGYLTVPRRVFSLFHPYNGAGSTARWVTMWDPIGSGTKDTCTYGNGGLDIPVPGVRLNSDLYSDMVVYRGESGSSPGYFHFKNSTPSVANSCSGTGQTVQYAAFNRPRFRVFAVSDMTGDGKPDIMLVHPETMTIEWMFSDTNFFSGDIRTNVGTHRAIVL